MVNGRVISMTTKPAGQPAHIDEQVTDLLDAMQPLAMHGDGDLRDLLVQLERVTNMAQASSASVITEIAQRAERDDQAEAVRRRRSLLPHESRTEFVADELAVTLTCTKVDAASRYALALATREHPVVTAQWRTGTITARKAQIICDGLTDVSNPARHDIAVSASQYGVTHTGPELRRWLQRRVISADPGMAEVRRKRAIADRKVTVTPLFDGVSELYALLPSVQARQVYDTVNAIAQMAGPEDARSMDQRRADALIDVLTGRAEPPQVFVQVVVPIDCLLGESAEPGFIAGVGPITSSEALDLAGVTHHDPCGLPECNPTGGLDYSFAGGTSLEGNVAFRRLMTDPESGYLTEISERQYRPSAALDRAVRARDAVCRFPGCSRPATKRSGTDLDHTIPWPRGKTEASNLAALCRHHHRVKHSPGWSAELAPDGVMTWTTPAGKRFRTEPWAYSRQFGAEDPPSPNAPRIDTG